MDDPPKLQEMLPPDTLGEFEDWEVPPDDPEDRLEMRVYQGFQLASRPRFILPDLLPRQSVGIVVAEPHVGKTFLMVDLAIALATGQSFMGVAPTERTTSLALYLDSSGWAMRYLVENILAGRAADWREVNQRALYKLRDSTKRIDINDDKDVADIIETCKHYNAGVLIIDCFSKVNKADENSRAVMEVVMDRLSLIAHETDAAVLVLDHTPVAGRQDRKSVFQARGSGVKEADIDLMWHLRNGRGGVKELELRKARGMRTEGTVYTFRLAPVCVEGVRDAVKVEVLSVGKAAERGQQQETLENAVMEVLEGGECEVGEIVKAVVSAGVVRAEKGVKAVRNALTRLRKEGEVRRVRKNVWAAGEEIEDGANEVDIG